MSQPGYLLDLFYFGDCIYEIIIPDMIQIHLASYKCNSGFPLKSYLPISCVLSVRLEVFPVPISEICDNLICNTDFLQQISQHHVSLASENLQLEQFFSNSLCFP